MELLSGIALQKYKEAIRLSPIQKDFLIGTILGDGNLRFLRRNQEANLSIDHGFGQEKYVLWKYEIMKDWVMTRPKLLRRAYHRDISRVLTSFRFATISHKEFTSLYRTFYKGGVKVIPNNISEILTSPFSLATWFMDDGNKNYRAVFLNTQQFSLVGQELLRECLWKNFGLHSTLNKHWAYGGKQFFRIRITTESTRALYALIKEFLLPSMQYKFPHYPRNDSVREIIAAG